MTDHVNDQQIALPAGTWRLDPSTTTITVTATKLGIFSIPAELKAIAGTIEIDSEHHVTSAEVVADANTYTSGNTKRNEHIRSADFLDAENHPNLVFKAGTVVPAGDGYETEGSVTVKGKTSPARVTITDIELDATSGSFRAAATLDRAALGVDKLPSFIIGNTLQLVVNASVVPANV